MEFTDEEKIFVEKARSYQELLEVARSVLKRQFTLSSNLGVGMVCGPISTGGLGSIDKNMQRFELAINTLRKLNLEIFSQMPFEPAMWRIRNSRVGEGSYDYSLLDEFYLPIFESGMITTKYFIPGWESSTGAKWERNHAFRLSIKVVDLDDSLRPSK